MPTKKIVANANYEQYVPAKVSLSSKQKNWDGLLLTEYIHPRQTDGCPRPATTDHILGFMASGAQKGEYSYGRQVWRPFASNKGDWIIQQAFENQHVNFRWEAACDEQEALTSYLIHVSPKLLERAANESTSNNGDHVELPHRINFRDPLLVELASALRCEAERETVHSRLYVETVTQLLALHLLQNYCTRRYKIPTYNKNLPSVRLGRVIDYIHAHLHEDLSLHAMAKLAHMSTYHFARTFKKTTGDAPHQYLVRCRVEKAKHLLETTDLSVGRIAAETGHHDPSTFTTMFKRLTATTPSQYRKN